MSAPRKREPRKADVDAAIIAERELAEAAGVLRGDAVVLTPDLFLKLYELARRPIPKGFILYVSAGDGKPYASTGIKSVQVQIDRMHAVFTPLWWDCQTEYHEGGKLAEVTVTVHVEGRPVKASAWGGVDRANTLGNLRKGSFTNAAKMAFARLGPGHEVYLGATDHDPDVDPDAAKAQAAPPQPTQSNGGEAQPLGAASRQKVIDAFAEAGITDEFGLYLTAVGAANQEEITASQAYRLRELLDAHIAKEAGK